MLNDKICMSSSASSAELRNTISYSGCQIFFFHMKNTSGSDVDWIC